MIDQNQQSIRGYTILEQIGVGDFSMVYRAYQVTLKREVALKVILPEYANNPNFILRFEREAAFIAQLEHPNIVPIFDYWREPDGARLVMRLIRGRSLYEEIKQAPLIMTKVLHTLDAISSALDYAHRNGIIHRDVKPKNILFDTEGNAYLGDFRIAKDMQPDVEKLTGTGNIVGTLEYCSPEQLSAGALNPQSDIFSLGIVLYEMLTGEYPFPNTSPATCAAHLVHDPLPRLTIDSASDALNAVIQKATAKDPSQRYGNPLEMAAAFREAVDTNQAQIEALTPRELEVLQHLADGLSNGEIAGAMFIARSTVNFHLQQIYPKLAVNNRAQAIVVAHQQGLIFRDLPQEDEVNVELFNPYKGLRAFQEYDHRDFYGREALIERVLIKLAEKHQQFLALVGPSGSGKSSVIKAGILPRLREGAVAGSGNWFIVDMFPGSLPFAELEAAMLRVAVNPPGSLIEILRGEDGIARAMKHILPDENSILLLVIDQFEELFTLVDDERERTHFIESLLTALYDPRGCLQVIVTLRADFFDRPLMYDELGDLIRKRTEVILPPSPEELSAAIVQPAKNVGAVFEAGLVDAILNDVQDHPGTLPLLQFALTQLFERRRGRKLTLEDYQAIGGAFGALAKRAEEIYCELNETQQTTTRQLFLRLVTLGEGTEDTRRRVLQSELSGLEDLKSVLHVFGNARLLTFDHESGTREPTVEAAHEALIRTWERLDEWINYSRQDLRIHRQLTNTTHEWLSSEQDSSFLAFGMRLEELQFWSKTTDIILNEQEQAYIDSSIANQAERHRIEVARMTQEAHTARRAQNFQRTTIGLALVALVTVILTFFSTLAGLDAYNQRTVAEQQVQVIGTQVAETLTPIPVILTQVAETVVYQEGQALTIDIALQAEDAYEWDTLLGLSLAIEAVGISENVIKAQRTLGELAYTPGLYRHFEGHSGPVWSVAFSPDGRQIISGSSDRSIILWDVATSSIIRRFEGHFGPVWSVAFSPDGRQIVSGSDDTQVILWDVISGSIIHRFEGHTRPVHSVAFTPDGQQIVSGSRFNLIRWNVADGSRMPGANFEAAWSLAFSPDGSQFVVAIHDYNIFLLDAADGSYIRHFGMPNSESNVVAFSPDGRQIISGSSLRNLILWDVETGSRIRDFEGHTDWVTSVAFSPDGQQIVSSSDDHRIMLWNVETGEVLHRFTVQDTKIKSVAFSPDGQQVVSGSDDNSVMVWDIVDGSQVNHFETDEAIWSVAFSPDGHHIISGSEDESLILWDLVLGSQIRRYEGHTGAVRSVAFSPDGNQIVSGSEDKNLILWDLVSGSQIHRFKRQNSTIWSVAFSPGGQQVVSGLGNGNMILWDITGDQIRLYEGHSSAITSVAFSPDGNQIVSGSQDRSIILWDAATGTQIRRFEGHSSAVRSVAFSPNGNQIVSGSQDRSIILWDVATGTQIRHYEGHTGWVWSVAFSPDGRQIVSGSQDRSIILWDVATGTKIRRYEGHTGWVWSVTFSPDGNHIVSSSVDNFVIVWRVPNVNQLLDWIHNNREVRQLSCQERARYGLVSCDGEILSDNVPAIRHN